MKNLFFVTLLIFEFAITYAQNGALTVINHSSSGCSYSVTMYAKCTCCGTPTCNQIVANQFTVPSGVTFTWTDPCDFETGGSYNPSCSPLCTAVGFTTMVCGGSGGCYLAGTVGFNWTYAYIDYPGCSYGTTGALSGSGCGSNPLYGSSPYYATWTNGSTNPLDVQIDIY